MRYLILFVLTTVVSFAAGPDRVQGTLTITVADYFAQHRSETKYFIEGQTDRSYELHLAAPRNDLINGMIVRGQGRINGSILEDADVTVLDSGSLFRSGSSVATATGLPTITPSSGVQKTLVFNLVSNAPGALPANFTNSQLQDRMFGPSGLSVSTLYQESSFNSVSFAGDVVGPYAISNPDICNNPRSFQIEANQLAAAAGVNTAGYAHYIYMYPSEVAGICTYGGLTIGQDTSVINTGYYYPSDSGVLVALAHELGHQLNMSHAQAIQSNGAVDNYGDNSCIMGDENYNVIDFNVIHRIQQGWIALGNILQVTSSGTYTVNLAESQTSQVQALQIADPSSPYKICPFPPCAAGSPLYVSYRQPIGLDRNLPSPFLGGASIVYWDGSFSELVTNYPWGGALTDNMTYTSADGAVTVTQLSHTSSSVTVQVNIHAGATVFTDASAASFNNGPLASGSIVAAFGSGLATSTESATALPLPTTLGGATVTVQDSAGISRPAPLFYASSKQINYAIPDGTANGVATITIANSKVTAQQGELIDSVAPGMFAAGGVALGNVLTSVNGNFQYSNTFQVVGGAIAPAPIDIGNASTPVYLVLYGTGIRNHAHPVTAVFAAKTPVTVTALSAGAATSVGEDQINILLPQSLRGAGLINVALSVDGQNANPVQVLIQ